VKAVQQFSYAQEFKELMEKQEVAVNSSLKTLHPFIDKEGLIRVGGRLRHSTLPYQIIHQMILPANHHFSRLVVSSEHIRLLHAGPQLLIASLREKYWIPRIKSVVKTVIHQCLTCYKLKARATQQLMGELPSARVQPSRPFLTTGVDYAGPVLLKLGMPRSKTTTKGYIAIFVCFATKAIHIEVVTSLTTEAFLAALRRFISRRGKPRTIHSDNGTNFQGAANELHAIYKMLQSTSQMATIRDFMATEGCDWNFIPPNSPHFGALCEAAVKSMKPHLRRTLGSRVATYEELCTLLSEIEACLNSRPLCTLSDDPSNPSYLSPGHFLIGEPLTQLPAIDLSNVNTNRLSRWQTYQQQVQHFWQRWSADYLQSLQQRHRWTRTTPNFQPGDIVLIKEDTTTPLQWPLAVIQDIHPGKDGIVRVVTVKTPKGVYKRPTSKICPLPCVNYM
jgi:transposase InsO family protein